MALKGYLIEKYNRMADAYTCARLAEEAAALGIDLRIVGVQDCAVSALGVMNDGRIMEERDFVINRYGTGKIRDAVNALARRSYNPLPAFDIYINKYDQIRTLRSEEFIVPGYVLGTADLPFTEITGLLGLPFVAKGLESSMGEEVALIEKREDLERLRQLHGPKKEWLYEEFIRSGAGRDMRLFSIRGEAVACMERRAKGDFRANVALGAEVKALEITPAVRRIAGDIYRQTGLDFLGIDLLFGTDKPYFCEINVKPGIRGIETACGVNVARKIIETIKEDFRA